MFRATLLTVAKQWTRPRRQVTGIAIKEMWPRDFFGSPVVRTPHFHCRGRGFQSLVRELRSCKFCHMAKEKRKKCSLSVQGNITCVHAHTHTQVNRILKTAEGIQLGIATFERKNQLQAFLLCSFYLYNLKIFLNSY